jgi:hypothetical protein
MVAEGMEINGNGRWWSVGGSEPTLGEPRRIAADGPAYRTDKVTAHVVSAPVQDVAAVPTLVTDRLRDPDGLTADDDEGIDVPGHASLRNDAKDGVDRGPAMKVREGVGHS